MKSAVLPLAALATLVPYVAAQAGAYAQCGGNNWSGETTCVSGYACTYSNDWYSQCLVGSASQAPASTTVVAVTRPTSTTKMTTSTKPAPSSTSTTITSSSSSVAAPAPSSALPFLGGVNTAGYDFSVSTDGSFSGTGVSPPVSQYAHFAAQGVNVFRVPFAWQLMTPTLGGSIDTSFLAKYDATVNAALSASTAPYVIIDLHNYARWNGGIIGQGGPTNAQYASIWTQLAKHYASNPKIIFGIMNEPHDLPSLTSWAGSVQAAVNAIRAAGATSQYILIPGSSYSSAQTLPTEAGPALLTVTDPAGGVNKLIFDVHKYLDSDNSGTNPTCVTDNTAVLQTLYNWLQTNGRQALLSETGGGNTQSCYTDLKAELAFLKAHSDHLVGFTVWSAGAFDTSYTLTVTPNSDGSDQPLWTNAVKPNLP